jgi:hypothetical protein
LYFYLVNSQFLIVLLKEKKNLIHGFRVVVMVMDEFSHHHLSHPSLNTLRTILIFHKKKTFVLVSFTILGSREKRWCLHGGKASTFFFFF